MSLDAPADTSPPIGSVDDLVSWLRVGEKPAAQHRIGVETEKLGVVARTGEPAPLAAIGRLLGGIAEATGGRLLEENGAAIGVLLKESSVALEPGGQLELSGRPTRRLSEIRGEIAEHLSLVRRLSERDGLAWLGTGYRPFGNRADVPWLPRGRYELMRQRMKGRYAHDMMQMTASVQANFDFADEADLAAKVSCATAVSPIIAALYANSPLSDGQPNGRQSQRYFVWSDVDPPRCGLVRIMYEPGFTYRRYVDWALAIPLLFIRRRGQYVDPGGKTLGDVMREGLAGEPASMLDFTDLLSTLFPEIRVKRVIEVRGADAVNVPLTIALPALWTGLLYDATARADARRLIDVPFEVLVAYQLDVARGALRSRLQGKATIDLAKDVLRLADDGLRRRAERGEGDASDRALLDPLREIVASGKTSADRVLEVAQRTPGDRASIIRALAF
jgi:glutamate--cysteine ligase